ncbi:MAG: hypothetical protein R3A47_02195 [Polyangiales bacterium]
MPKKAKENDLMLVARPGARYTCFGDGLCCTDIHAIGPLTESEVDSVLELDDGAARWDDEHDEYMLCTAADGGCRFLLEDRRCSIHAELGADKKPEGCRRFPLGAVRIPDGARITTDHRCPCRTMGERPLITAEASIPSLLDEDGEVDFDREIKKVRLTWKEKISFDDWLEIENDLLSKLENGVDPSKVLGAPTFPDLKKSDWKEQAQEFLDARDGAQFGVAMAWFGDAILQLKYGERPRDPQQPWAAAFDRAEARSPNARTAKEVFADWIADEIWSLKWAEDFSFDVAKKELATRLLVAEHLCRRFIEKGAREDRAAAEAVMIVELVGESEYWTEIRQRIRDGAKG